MTDKDLIKLIDDFYGLSDEQDKLLDNALELISIGLQDLALKVIIVVQDNLFSKGETNE